MGLRWAKLSWNSATSRLLGGGWAKTKTMLKLTQVEVEVGVELSDKNMKI